MNILSTNESEPERVEFSFSSTRSFWNSSGGELTVTSSEAAELEWSAFNNESTKLALRSSTVSSTSANDSPVRSQML